MNGINLEALVKDEFLNMFSELLKFDLNDDVIITPQLKECVDIIMDEKSALPASDVRKMILRKWLPLLFSKFKSIIPIFNRNRSRPFKSKNMI